MNLLQSKLLYPVAFIIVFLGVFYFSPLALMTPSPDPGISNENGTYRNPCCSPIVLADGELTSGDVKVAYVIDPAPESLPNSVFLRPKRRLSVSGGVRIIAEPSDNPASLLIKKSGDQPESITLWGERSKQFVFRRDK